MSIDETFSNLSDHIFGLKEKLTDLEYKDLLGLLNELRISKKKTSLYVFTYYHQYFVPYAQYDTNGNLEFINNLKIEKERVICTIDEEILKHPIQLLMHKININKHIYSESTCKIPHLEYLEHNENIEYINTIQRDKSEEMVKYANIIPISLESLNI